MAGGLFALLSCSLETTVFCNYSLSLRPYIQEELDHI